MGIKKRMRGLLFLIVLGAMGLPAKGQLVIDSFTSDNTFIQLRPGRAIGSSFNAGPANVTANAVRLKISNVLGANSDAIIHLYAGNNPAGQNCIASSPVVSMTAAGFYDFTFTAPVSLSANQEYTWLIYPANGTFADIRSGNGAPPKLGYIGFSGISAQCPSGPVPGFNATPYFEILGSNTPVPTMSQWGLIIFGLTVLCIGAVVLHRRRFGALTREIA